MRLRRLHLPAYGPFTDRVLDFGDRARSLVLVHGPNEAGKSSTLRAMADLRFGIPAQSRDNFVHAHADLRIGGEFVDREGRPHGFVRRKGRGGTLLAADFGDGSSVASVGDAVPPEVEALLTGGLVREAYESMFALDHMRLREGGKALLKGEGDIGAALFEASAGVRSIPQMLQRLEDASRRYFMPGARGKNARINQALATYNERNAEFKSSLVRPVQWAELFRQHRSAADALAALEQSLRASQVSLLQVKELRAVAPLIAALDGALAALVVLDGVRMLPPDAPAVRAAAESGLFDARQNAREAAAEVERQQVLIDALRPDAAVLAAAAAVRRLDSAAETIEPRRRDIAVARGEVERETQALERIALRIDPAAPAAEVVARAPTRTARAGIETALRQLDLARQALEQQAASGVRESDTRSAAAEAPPPVEARTELHPAQAEVARHDTVVQRLAALPVAVRTAERQVAQALAAAGLPDVAALSGVRLLLPAQIDHALEQEGASAVRRGGLVSRIDAIAAALVDAAGRRDELLAGGAPATRDDVADARRRREASWALLRDTYIDRVAPVPANDLFTEGGALPAAYVEAVREADRLVDALAGDTARSSALQALRREIANLERDRDALARQLADIGAADERRIDEWRHLLAHGGLPPLAPAAMRQWQPLFAKAVESADALRLLRDQLDEATSLERDLSARLRAALAAVGGGAASGGEGASLPTLAALATALEDEFRRRERAADAARGEREHRERAAREHRARLDERTAALAAAQARLAVHLGVLGLDGEVDAAVVRARLAEFDELLATHVRLLAAQSHETQSSQVLALLADGAAAVLAQLGEDVTADVRAGIDALAARLVAAEAVEHRRELALQAHASAADALQAHRRTATRHQATLEALCSAAGVAQAALLPEAEEQSRRKREAMQEIDRSRGHLAQVTSRDLDGLRSALAGWDVARMEAEEHALAEAQSRTEEALQSARAAEESTRRALEAVDGSDVAATAREGMEQAAARVRADMAPWMRSRLAHALLAEALKRFRDRAQGPMLQAATTYFGAMTHGEFDRLLGDDSGKEPALVAQRRNGARIRVEEMSEGTLDQLYLALRLAALDVRRGAGVDLPVVFDDVLMTSDEGRSGAMLQALAAFAGGTPGTPGSQVIVFTHHRHLVEIAQRELPGEVLRVVSI